MVSGPGLTFSFCRGRCFGLCFEASFGLGFLAVAGVGFRLSLRVLFCFMAGSPLHLECVYIGSLTHPAGSRPSHPISVLPTFREGSDRVAKSVRAVYAFPETTL